MSTSVLRASPTPDFRMTGRLDLTKETPKENANSVGVWTLEWLMKLPITPG
jgi:hypothetical protein